MPPECRRCLTHHAESEACQLIGIEGRLRARKEALQMENERLRDALNGVVAVASRHRVPSGKAARDMVVVASSALREPSAS